MRLSVLALLVLAAGCGGSRNSGPYTDGGRVERDIAAAQAFYREAREALAESDLEEGELLLRQALNADLYHGGAHNDLGVLLLQRGRLYEAAHEFEWARKLLPGHPDPRVNLAITLARGQKFDEAIRSAQAALEARPNYLPAHQVLASIQLRHGLADEDTAEHLAVIIERTTDPRWRRWAIEQQLRLDGSADDS